MVHRLQGVPRHTAEACDAQHRQAARYRSPADAALQTDFSIGVTSISAISVAALKGARVLYLDYENLEESSASTSSDQRNG